MPTVLPRLFSREDVHPYDEISWVQHNLVLPGLSNGSLSQRLVGVEFPDFWSANAATVVASRYFRGTPGTPQQETSLRQVIDRVVAAYRHHGLTHGQLAQAAGAEVFAAELTAAILQQVLSFNSPVWFNVGTDEPQQVAACVVLDVRDSLRSIRRWYNDESATFAGGAGAGVNLSDLRSSKESLPTGAPATGPLAFMRAADAAAAAIRSGGAARGPARMIVLDVDHPDIVDFVEAKAREERKIRVLQVAGFDMDLNGADIATVQYQNANHAVRVSDEFMRAAASDSLFTLRRRTDGAAHADISARGLLRQIAAAAWECGDPGIHYDDTINAWHTTPSTGRLTATNGCSEYHGPQNSSASIISLNLMAFLRPDGTFDTGRFLHSVGLAVTALDIGVTFGECPNEEIARVTRRYRPISVGYANLGGILMAMGLPYDSDEGRLTAAAITSLMTAAAYTRSAMLASRLGAYEGYAENADAHRAVVARHAAAHDCLTPKTGIVSPILAAAGQAWRDALALGSQYGWRNCQVSLVPPTGTVSLMMDCDTPGVEPAYALVSTKELLGGGVLHMTPGALAVGLRRLGYHQEEREAIIRHAHQHGSVAGAPELKADHLPVFATAIGENVIAPHGHLLMMAAIQPFLSGSASKTVNLSEYSTVDQIEEIIVQAWRLGLKAISIYRDNSKAGQPLRA